MLKLPLKPNFNRKFSAVDIRLKDGTEYYAIAVDADGNLLGKIVGGQIGINESPLPFTQQEIVAYRPYWGFFARIGIRRWNQTTSLY